MTKQQIINLAVERLKLVPTLLEENDINGFMATILEVLDDEGINEVNFFGTTNENEAINILYPMAEEVRNSIFAAT
jgi:hypothetical protein